MNGKRVLFLISIAIPILTVSSSAWAQVNGIWARSESDCPRSDTDYERIEGNYRAIKVTPNSLGFLGGEGLACSFEGGDRSDPEFWTLKGRCGEEGDEDRPLVQVDLQIKNGILEFRRAGERTRYAIKCSAAIP